MTDQHLSDQVVLIVGGTSGLGLSAARACLRHGARVVVVGRSSSKCQAVADELGDDVRTVVGDAAVPDTSQRAVECAITQFGELHALYHVAGGSGRSSGDGPLHLVSDEGWAGTLRHNLDAVFHSNREATRYFLSEGRAGSVLNMTSVLANSPSPRHFATHTYATAKAAIVGLTLSSAAYYAEHRIRFNAIAPALVETPMAKRASQNEEIMQFVRSKQPLDGGRIGKPEDLDSAVVFFLSRESLFVTGQVLAVDGGWSLTDGQYKR